MKTTQGIIKVAGLLVCIAGVAVLTFYKGPQLQPVFHHHLLDYHDATHHHQSHDSPNKRWIIGCSLFFISIISFSLWLVLQVNILPNTFRVQSIIAHYFCRFGFSINYINICVYHACFPDQFPLFCIEFVARMC